MILGRGRSHSAPGTGCECCIVLTTPCCHRCKKRRRGGPRVWRTSLALTDPPSTIRCTSSSPCMQKSSRRSRQRYGFFCYVNACADWMQTVGATGWVGACMSCVRHSFCVCLRLPKVRAKTNNQAPVCADCSHHSRGTVEGQGRHGGGAERPAQIQPPQSVSERVERHHCRYGMECAPKFRPSARFRSLIVAACSIPHAAVCICDG